jgi:hypothetical protein
MTTVYTLREKDDQELLRRISWRPLAYIQPDREEKRKEAELALKLSCVDVWPGGQIKWCWAFPRFDVADG